MERQAEGKGPGGGALLHRGPSQRQPKQVCVFTRGTAVNTSAILTWFSPVTLDHTLTLGPF